MSVYQRLFDQGKGRLCIQEAVFQEIICKFPLAMMDGTRRDEGVEEVAKCK
jgi:hypothetical protein